LWISVGLQQEQDAQSVQTPDITLPCSAFVTRNSTFPVGLSDMILVPLPSGGWEEAMMILRDFIYLVGEQFPKIQ